MGGGKNFAYQYFSFLCHDFINCWLYGVYRHFNTIFFFLLRIIIYKSKTIIFSFQRERIITSLFSKLTKNIKKFFQDRHQRNIWSVRNVQIYHISINPYFSGYRKFHSMLHSEALEVHYLKLYSAIARISVFLDFL